MLCNKYSAYLHIYSYDLRRIFHYLELRCSLFAIIAILDYSFKW